MKYIDSHCHLDMLVDQPGGLEAIVSESVAADVAHILSIAIDKASCKRVKALAEQFDNVTASVGIHPNENQTEHFTVEELVAEANHPKVIAIGETGLDYFRSEGDLEWQRDRFRIHIEAAKQT
jgi:TatD DNase family protein